MKPCDATYWWNSLVKTVLTKEPFSVDSFEDEEEEQKAEGGGGAGGAGERGQEQEFGAAADKAGD